MTTLWHDLRACGDRCLRPDPATYAAIVGLLLTVALAATLLPARRAARADPIVALRPD